MNRLLLLPLFALLLAAENPPAPVPEVRIPGGKVIPLICPKCFTDAQGNPTVTVKKAEPGLGGTLYRQYLEWTCAKCKAKFGLAENKWVRDAEGRP